MKRTTLLISFFLFVALSMSAAYWALTLFKPVARQVVAPPPAPPLEVKLDAANGLFGGRATAAVASNYQLKGVIAAQHGRGSVAIIVADGRSAQIVGVGAEVAPGVTVKEVHAQYVILSDSGVLKRIEWPEGAVALASVQSAENGQVLSAPSVVAIPGATPPAVTAPRPATVAARLGSSGAAGLPPMPNEQRIVNYNRRAPAQQQRNQ